MAWKTSIARGSGQGCARWDAEDSFGDALLQVDHDQCGSGSRVVSGIGFFSFGFNPQQAGKTARVPPKLLLLARGEFLRDGPGKPVLPRGPAHLKPLPAFGGERNQSLPPVARVWREPLTRPASCSGVTTALMDCGRMPSARARLETVAEPSFSSRRRTETCDGVRSSRPPCSRKRRLSLPPTVRISAASVEASRVRKTFDCSRDQYLISTGKL